MAVNSTDADARFLGLLTNETEFRIKWKVVPLSPINTGQRRWPHINAKKEITMHNKPVALVTGANKGIGLQTPRAQLE